MKKLNPAAVVMFVAPVMVCVPASKWYASNVAFVPLAIVVFVV